ncbi:MAG TPA: YciI family protein [Jiangellaceae bacterium]|nr:YciI family protein [Jiangellaceae bacterium]
MKYMIMMFGDQSGMEDKSPEWMKNMIEFMFRIDKDLEKSGELVFQQGLADPSQAKLVDLRDGVPVATDGPFAESKESLAGFWVVDVESEARVIEIASQVVAVIEGPVEVREAMDAPPDEVLEAFGVPPTG